MKTIEEIESTAKKHEEIEKKAWELYTKHLSSHKAWEGFIGDLLEDCWYQAEKFYDYAKEKQEEASDE